MAQKVLGVKNTRCVYKKAKPAISNTAFRKRLKLPAEQAIFLFVNGIIPATAALMNTVHEEHKDPDGFLYVTYSGENTFGDSLGDVRH